MLLFLASEKYYTRSTEDGYEVAYIVAPDKDTALKIATRSDENGPSVIYPHFDLFELGYFAPSVPVLVAGREQEVYTHGGFILSSYTVPFTDDSTLILPTEVPNDIPEDDTLAYANYIRDYRARYFSFTPVDSDGWEERRETHGFDHTFPVWVSPVLGLRFTPSRRKVISCL